MSKGRKNVIVRMSDGMIADIEAECAKRLEHHACQPWTVSHFVRAAVQELLRKKAASRTRGKKGKGK